MTRQLIPSAVLNAIPNLDARRLLQDHFDHEPDDINKAALAELRTRIRAADAIVDAERKKLVEQHLAPLHAELEVLEKPCRDAEEARWLYLETRLKAMDVEFTDFQFHDDYCGVYRCAVTGLPLLHDDQTVKTPDDEPFLYCVVPGVEGPAFAGDIEPSDTDVSPPQNAAPA